MLSSVQIEVCDDSLAPFAALDLLRWRCVCRSWRQRWSSPHVWRQLFHNGVCFNGRHLSVETLTFMAQLQPSVLTRLALDLSGCGIGDAGMATLARSIRPGLRRLELSVAGCGISDKGATALGAALPVELVELSLDFRYCNIRQPGAEAIASILSTGLEKLFLDFGGCIVRDGGAEAVAQKLDLSLRHLSLGFGGCHLSHPGADCVFARLPSLHDLAALSLNFYGISVKDHWLPAVDTLFFNDSLVSILLDFSLCEFGDRGLSAIAAQLPSSLHYLCLKLVGCDIGHRGVADLATNLPQDLRQLSVDLSGCELEDESAIALASAIPGSVKELSLGFSGCSLSHIGVRAIAVGLPARLSSLILDLSGAALGTSPSCDGGTPLVVDDGAVVLFKALPKTLVSLDLDFNTCKIGQCAAEMLAQIVSSSLRYIVELKLDFTSCSLGMDGVCALHDAIGSLEHLLVKNVSYDAYGTDVIVAGLDASDEDDAALQLYEPYDFCWRGFCHHYAWRR